MKHNQSTCLTILAVLFLSLLTCRTGGAATTSLIADDPATQSAANLPDARRLARLALTEAQKIQPDSARAMPLMSIIRTLGRTGDVQGVRDAAKALQKAIGAEKQQDRDFAQAEADMAAAGAFAAGGDRKTYKELMDKVQAEPQGKDLPPIDTVPTFLAAGEYDKLITFPLEWGTAIWFTGVIEDVYSHNADKAKELVKRIDELAEKGVGYDDHGALRMASARDHAIIGDLDGAIARLAFIPGNEDRMASEEVLLDDRVNAGDQAGADKIYRDILKKSPNPMAVEEILVDDLLKAGDPTGARTVYQDILQKVPHPDFDVNLFRLYLRFGDTNAAGKMLDRLCKSINAGTKPPYDPSMSRSEGQAAWCEEAATGAALLGKDDIAGKYRDAYIRFSTSGEHPPDLAAAFAQEIDGKIQEQHAEFLASQGHIREAIEAATRITRSDGITGDVRGLLLTAIKGDDLATAIAALQKMPPAENDGTSIESVARMMIQERRAHPVDALAWVESLPDPGERAEAARSLADETLREQQTKAVTRPSATRQTTPTPTDAIKNN